MKRYGIRMKLDLFERVKLLARKYNISINKLIIELIETGYVEHIKREDKND